MNVAENKHNGMEPKLLEIGKYRFEWECYIMPQKTIRISATETLTKDKFLRQYDMEDLIAMKFFKSNPEDIKCFIQRIMFNNTQEMFYQIGFIPYDTYEQREGHPSLKTNEYNKNDKMCILLHYKNEWIQGKWELVLDYIPQSDDIKLQSIVRDLQFENRKLTKQIESMKINLVPKGTIVMWSGATHNIPSGWKLCDGSYNTPDLRDRFVLGGGGAYAIGDKGGNKTHVHSVVVHGTKLQIKHIPQHQHHIGRDFWDIQSGGGGNKYRLLCANKFGDRKIYTNYIGGGQSHDHLSHCTNSSHIPPYIVLAYIMKV